MRLTLFFLLSICITLPLAAQSIVPENTSAANTQNAQAVLDAMVQALGGDAWITMKSQSRQGHVAAFFQGKPSGSTTLFFEFHSWPGKDRIEYTKHRDIVQIYLDYKGWEVTYRGKKPLPSDQTDDFLRRRDHSIETALKSWRKDPRTLLLYEGQHLAARHLADQVTLISADNEAITILTDVQTHLPLRSSFEWRDPVYKDKNLDAEEYDDYHTVDGFPIPFTVTRFRNNEMVSQSYLDHAACNLHLEEGIFDPDSTEHSLRKE